MLTWMSKQAFSHYDNWECHAAGFWKGAGCDHSNHQASAQLLCSLAFIDAMRSLALCWPVSCAVHLSDAGLNRRAWLGQASCFMETGNCIECTKLAWSQLTAAEQAFANNNATEFYEQWTATNIERGHYQKQRHQSAYLF